MHVALKLPGNPGSDMHEQNSHRYDLVRRLVDTRFRSGGICREPGRVGGWTTAPSISATR